MKKNNSLLFISWLILLTGCLENTEETTINADGSGMLSNKSDMSALVGVIKQMGAGEQLEGADQVIDSTISIAEMADNIPELNEDERQKAKTGTLKLKIDIKNDQFLTTLFFPFTSINDAPAYNALSAKLMAEVAKGFMGEGMPAGMEMPAPSSFENYFAVAFTDGLLTKTLNKEKYAGAADDEYLKSMQETSTMGLTMKTNYIINLPRPAKVAEGKGLKISEDKRKITITTDIDDFFDDPTRLEYRIEY